MSHTQAEQTGKSLYTIRFTPHAHVKMMKLVGKDESDLVVYVEQGAEDAVTSAFQTAGFNVVEREFKLHASAESEEALTLSLGATKHYAELRGNVNGRFIATVTVHSREDFDRLRNTEFTGCRFTPFKARFAHRGKDESVPQHVPVVRESSQPRGDKEQPWIQVGKSKGKKSDHQTGDRKGERRVGGDKSRQDTKEPRRGRGGQKK